MASVSEIVTRPQERVHVAKWLKKNLFSSWFNTLLTVLSLALMYTVLSQLLTWIVTVANWRVITVNLRLFMVGTYPLDQTWRLWFCVAIGMTLLGLSWGIWPRVVSRVAIVYGAALLLLALAPFGVTTRIWLAGCGGLVFVGMFVGRHMPYVGRWVALAWFGFLPLMLILMRGFGAFLPVVSTRQWGGLQLTLVLAITGIAFSFPLGVLLAIGRRSPLPAISLCCTLYIELIRAVPLITVLFMFQIMLPLFIPGGESFDRIIRAIVAFTLFTAAYIAENVRGGLQAIPRGQFEAARALGLNPFLTMSFIILPQALRIVIPANVGQFISLFKDTSLVVIAALLDLLGIGRSVLAQSEFLGLQTEVLLFVAAVYWICTFSMSYISKRLEQTIGGGNR